MRYTFFAIVASAVLFGATRSFARQEPRTMTKEWQEASNEYMKVRWDCASLTEACCELGSGLC